LADHSSRPAGTPLAGPRAARLRRLAPGSDVVRRLHLPALLGGPGVFSFV